VQGRSSAAYKVGSFAPGWVQNLVSLTPSAGTGVLSLLQLFSCQDSRHPNLRPREEDGTRKT